MTRILVIHGPNLNILGDRDRDCYGNLSLAQINELLYSEAQLLGIQLEIYQSNIEGDIVNKIQTVKELIDGILINPAGFGYTSVSIRDALMDSRLPVVEVHLSNIHARENFRRHTILSEIAIGQIAGFKEMSYLLGLKALSNVILQDKIQ